MPLRAAYREDSRRRASVAARAPPSSAAPIPNSANADGSGTTLKLEEIVPMAPAAVETELDDNEDALPPVPPAAVVVLVCSAARLCNSAAKAVLVVEELLEDTPVTNDELLAPAAASAESELTPV